MMAAIGSLVVLPQAARFWHQWSGAMTVTSTPANRAMDLKKITSPVLRHLLRGHVRFPSLFLLRCKITVGQLKSRIDPTFPRELVELAALPIWVYLNLKEHIGQATALEIMRVAILTGGILQCRPWIASTYRGADVVFG
jgi:hypothetical protein